MAGIDITGYRWRNITDTDANFLASDPVPLVGEILLTSDKNELRFGDGVKKYSELDPISGGGGIGELQVPQPKTWVEKWNDGGAGNVTSRVNTWGDGIFIVEFKDTTVNRMETNVIDTTDTSVTRNEGQQVGTHSTTYALAYLDRADDTFKIDENTSSSFVLVRIQRWEDDPDNLPLQTIPADPALIKDWVEKFGPGLGSTPAASVTNAWGDGKYRFLIAATAGAETISTQLTVIDGVATNADLATDRGGVQLQRTVSGNTFDVTTAGWEIYQILRWEDVAGQDAQLNPPVDGWEEVWNDGGAGNITSVVNSWGTGHFVIDTLASTFPTVDKRTHYLFLPDLSNSVGGLYIGGSTTTGVFGYENSTNSFQDLTGSFTTGIVSIRKFNSLVNVLHTYHPDPRSVAQKDWVEVFAGNSASVTNVWGTGHYRLTVNRTSDGFRTTVTLRINGDETGSAVSLAGAVGGTDITANYTVSTNTFDATSGQTIFKIERWQDSQASDAPRTVLDDGYEIVYENPANTGNVTLSAENGDYLVTIDNGTASFTVDVTVNNGLTTCNGTWAVTGNVGQNVTYTVATNVWSVTAAGYYVKLIKKATGKTVINAQLATISLSDGDNQVQAINTDAGDVAVTLPPSPSQGDLFEVWNVGTNGNHVTGLPNSISLGDGKGLRLRYVTGWKYEDVIIDEYTDTSTANEINVVTKWAGGKMRIVSNTSKGTATQSVTYPEPFVSAPSASGAASTSGVGAIEIQSITTTGHSLYGLDMNANLFSGNRCSTVEGRWKTGV